MYRILVETVVHGAGAHSFIYEFPTKEAAIRALTVINEESGYSKAIAWYF